MLVAEGDEDKQWFEESRHRWEKEQRRRQAERQAERRRVQKLHQRLREATARVQEAERARLTAEQERLAMIVEAHTAGLSVRQIAAAAGLSASRVHQLLHTTVNGATDTTVQDMTS